MTFYLFHKKIKNSQKNKKKKKKKKKKIEKKKIKKKIKKLKKNWLYKKKKKKMFIRPKISFAGSLLSKRCKAIINPFISISHLNSKCSNLFSTNKYFSTNVSREKSK